MIFVTVGTQAPFDRLLFAIEAWAIRNPEVKIFAQVGEGGLNSKHMQCAEDVTPEEFREHMQAAHVIVAHAGMGTILSALEYNKPVLVMPRRASLGEQRNEHQLATARRMAQRGLAHVAEDVDELANHLDRLSDFEPGVHVENERTKGLIGRLKQFIHEQ